MSSDLEESALAPPRYEHDRALIRLVGPVTVSSVIRLCDQVDMALTYYQYPRVELQFASPGGDAAALNYFLSRLAEWRLPPAAEIRTLALTEASSAAAIMLSLGDIGHRTAYSSSRLVYHHARAMLAEATPVTRSTMEEWGKSLGAADNRMLDTMVSHIWDNKVASLGESADIPSSQSLDELGFRDGVKLSSVADLRRLYNELNERDIPITPEVAKQVYLIDKII